jgi:hypothetical protein
VSRGQKLPLGDTGYTIEVEDLAPEPPFPIITKGYEGATSSVAIVRVTAPDRGGGGRRLVHALDLQPLP